MEAQKMRLRNLTPRKVVPNLEPYYPNYEVENDNYEKELASIRILFVMTEPMKTDPVEMLGLSQRAENVLKRHHIETIAQAVDRFNDITSKNWKRLKPLSGCGITAAKEIKSKLFEFMLNTMTEEEQVAYFEALNLINGGGLAVEFIEKGETEDA